MKSFCIGDRNYSEIFKYKFRSGVMRKDITEVQRVKEFGQHSTQQDSYIKDIIRYKAIVQETNAGYFYIDKNGLTIRTKKSPTLLT